MQVHRSWYSTFRLVLQIGCVTEEFFLIGGDRVARSDALNVDSLVFGGEVVLGIIDRVHLQLRKLFAAVIYRDIVHRQVVQLTVGAGDGRVKLFALDRSICSKGFRGVQFQLFKVVRKLFFQLIEIEIVVSRCSGFALLGKRLKGVRLLVRNFQVEVIQGNQVLLVGLCGGKRSIGFTWFICFIQFIKFCGQLCAAGIGRIGLGGFEKLVKVGGLRLGVISNVNREFIGRISQRGRLVRSQGLRSIRRVDVVSLTEVQIVETDIVKLVQGGEVRIVPHTVGGTVGGTVGLSDRFRRRLVLGDICIIRQIRK